MAGNEAGGGVRTARLTLIALVTATLALAPANKALAAGCTGSASGTAQYGEVDISVGKDCAASSIPRPPSGGNGSQTETIDCGTAASQSVVATGASSPCQYAALQCGRGVGSPPTPDVTNTVDVDTAADGQISIGQVSCNVRNSPAPAGVSGAAVLQEIRRRVPHPAVGVAPPGGISLVQTQTLFWVNTPVQVDLGAVRLAGQNVRLRVRLQQVNWDFGDGHTDTTADPGKAYDRADPCDTKMCPDYYGHVYRRHGTYTVSAEVSWTGQFQVAGGAWRQIPTPVLGPAQTTGTHIYQARGELVPDPTDPRPAH